MGGCQGVAVQFFCCSCAVSVCQGVAMQLLMCCGWLPGCCCLVVFYSVVGSCHGVAVWLVMRCVLMP